MFNLLKESKQKPKTLSKKDLGLVAYLAQQYNSFQFPMDVLYQHVTPFYMGDSEQEYRSRIFHINEMNILNVNLVVQFVMSIPGIVDLRRDDVRKLLRVHSSEIMMLMAARKYDPAVDGIRCKDGRRFYNREFYYKSDLGEFGENLLSFCKVLHYLSIRETEYATLTAVIFFTNTDNLMEPFKVKDLKDRYFKLLKNYVFTIRKDMQHFENLLGIREGLLRLANMNFEQRTNLGEQPQLSPFLQKLWRK